MATNNPQATWKHCDLCGAEYHANAGGALRGLCRNCGKLLESGKASARIVVAETKAMAQRKTNWR